MSIQDTINRINELARKAKTEGLTEEETVERDKLRRVYIDAMKASLVGQLEKIGVTAKIELVEWATWYTETYQGRNFQSTVVGMDASTLTASALMERFTSDHAKNFINFDDAEYDATMAKALSSVDDAEQTELYKRCETILTERAANVYIQDLCDLVAIKPELDGYRFYPLYVMDLSGVHYTK